jgi:PKD repeat protein
MSPTEERKYMKKIILLFFLIVIFSIWIHANDYIVVGEMFSNYVCQYCPAAQAGLEALFAANPGRVIPLVYYPGDHTTARRTIYAISTQTPISVFGGTSRYNGANNIDDVYADYYETMSVRDVVLSIDSDMSFTSNGLIQISAEIEMLDDIVAGDEDVMVHFFLSLDDGAGIDQSRFFVVAYKSQVFNLRTEAQTDIFIETFTFNQTWNLEHLRAVVLVQSAIGDSQPPPQTFNERYIYGADMTQLTGNIVSFASDIISGPPSLRVNFSDRSMITDNILSWSWNFGDGSDVSTEQNPTHIYTTSGSYNVTLTITTDAPATLERTFTNFISVQQSDEVSGTVAGIWSADNNPYVIVGDIEVPEDMSLEIGAGVTLEFDDGISMTVSGYLIVSGESNDIVTFTSTDGWGGIVLRDGTTPVEISYALFEHSNRTVISATSRDIIIENSDFISNFGGAGPAAISLQNARNSFVSGSYFANNSANPGSTNSCGAITLTSNSVLTIKNSIIVNNTGRAAGAIRLANSSTINIDNCTIFNNENTNTSAGGTILNNGSTVNMINSITNGSPVIRNSAGTNNVTYTRITGVTGEGNITAEPLFENVTTSIGHETTTEKEDWILSASSPCIDAGSPDPDYNDVEDPSNIGFALFPARGTTRNDMGAFGGAGFPLEDSTSEGEVTIPTPRQALHIATYPNPFNPMLHIDVSVVDTSSILNISVYNIRGQKVKHLMDEIPATSEFSLVWNGTDSTGRSLASGIYFIQVTNRTEQSVKKVVLLK